MFIEKHPSSRLAGQNLSTAGTDRVVLLGSGPGLAEVVKGLRGTRVDLSVVDGRRPVLEVDPWRRRVRLGGAGAAEIAYDRLVIATGKRFSFVGENRWYAAGADEALAVRVRLASEYAESEPDPVERARLLTFGVIGNRQVARDVAKLVEAEVAPELRSAARVVMADARDEAGSEPFEVATGRPVHAAVLIRAEGVSPAEAAGWFGAGIDGSGQVVVTDRCTIPQHDGIYVVDERRGRGAYVAAAIRLGCTGGVPGPFRRGRLRAWQDWAAAWA